MLQKIFRKISTLLVKPFLALYLKKQRIYVYKPFKLNILPGVFHPAFFYSTKFLLSFFQNINLNQKTVVEVGAGNGLISFFLSLKAKKVVALELSKVAIKGLKLNEQTNSKLLPNNVLQVVESNLFDALTPRVFDYIIVNPPYYPNLIKNDAELAWNCGLEFEYFKSFFCQVVNFMDSNSKIIMVLSNQCNLKKINEIATENSLLMVLKVKKKFLIEDNYIFEITLQN